MKITGKYVLSQIKEFEGFRSKPYKCPAGYWTIGYGSLCKENDPQIDSHEAEKRLSNEFNQAFAEASKQVPNLNDFAKLCAIASFIHNIGGKAFAQSSLKKSIISGDYAQAAKEFLRWTKYTDNGEKKESLGLLRRRIFEADIFLNGE